MCLKLDAMFSQMCEREKNRIHLIELFVIVYLNVGVLVHLHAFLLLLLLFFDCLFEFEQWVICLPFSPKMVVLP